MPQCPPKANVMLEEGLCYSHLGELRVCSVRGVALVTGSSVQRQIGSHWAWEAAMILSLWGLLVGAFSLTWGVAKVGCGGTSCLKASMYGAGGGSGHQSQLTTER